MKANLGSEGFLFDLSAYPLIEDMPKTKNLEAPVWTENKAVLIQRYLRYFVFITKHGTYLDGFSGPQEPDHPHSWAAKLVLESEPKRLRKFAFFELDQRKLTHLEALASNHPTKPKRKIAVHPGDMNTEIPKYLTANPIRPKEATFCLLDQHTFECEWNTVKTLATHKKEGNKIELFYFLAQGWIDRAFSGLKQPEEKLGRWWGDDSWQHLRKMPCVERGRFLMDRFKNELGYRYANPYPIFERGGNGRVMFWMIHASDHPEAPKLMVRAYNNAVAPLEPIEQLEWEIGKSSRKPALSKEDATLALYAN